MTRNILKVMPRTTTDDVRANDARADMQKFASLLSAYEALVLDPNGNKYIALAMEHDENFRIMQRIHEIVEQCSDVFSQ